MRDRAWSAGAFVAVALGVLLGLAALPFGLSGCTDQASVQAEIDRQQKVLDDFEAMLVKHQADLDAAIKAAADAGDSAAAEKARAERAATDAALAREAEAEKALAVARATLAAPAPGADVAGRVGGSGLLAAVPPPWGEAIGLGLAVGTVVLQQVRLRKVAGQLEVSKAKTEEATGAARSFINGLDSVKVAAPGGTVPIAGIASHPDFLDQLTPLAMAILKHETVD